MAEAEYKQILGRYLPPAAIDPIYDYMQRHRVQLRISPDRQSKLGDYRCPHSAHNYHEISVNGNLNPYHFLMVLLHEMGHLNTYIHHGIGVAPHGHEWQEQYRQLLAAYRSFFPPDVVPLLDKYIKRIPLSRTYGRKMEEQLHHYDPGYAPASHPILDKLQPGTCFRLARRPEKRFRAIEKRRTRWLCEELPSGRQFLVQGSAEVVVV